MAIWLRRISAALFLVCMQWGLATADTAAGVAAYDKGDFKSAHTLLQAEAEAGDGKAEYLYGIMYLRGQGVDQDVLAGRFWLVRAADHGDPNAVAARPKLEAVFKEFEDNGVPKTAGGDGSSLERAIILVDAKNEVQGVHAEHDIFLAFFRGWQWGTQSLLNNGGRAYDLIELTRGSEKRDLYFDISNWFGHME